ncbi:hypothetical protein Zmor_019820 [Zophobas morio]|uniref:Glucosylceramidase n=1 Tax=Zophobas morio TaxID=2755281 RepID=A0AA38M9F1_9CUCU|nr:hypothetical protein Zmor_019820 [Zophobas morio]
MLLVSALVVLTGHSLAQECQKRDYGNDGHVCVCNSTYCDTVPPPNRVEPPSYLIYTSNKAGLRFAKSEGRFIESNEISDKTIQIHPNEKYQEIFGWGGAFTDSTGVNLNSLDEPAQDNLLRAYFSNDGIEYSLCRVPIGGTDFSERGYSYDDGDEDPKLENFQLAPEDFKLKIPFIKKAQNLTGGNLRFFASVWTAPKWMKTNREYNGMWGFLRYEMYQSWADYFVKFFDKYSEQGIQFWGLVTGNEPSLAMVPFTKINSVAWTPAMLSTWVRDNLGPTIRNSSYSKIKIMMLDDQRLFLPWYPKLVLNDETTHKYVDGIAVHWYYDFLLSPRLLTETHDSFPDKFLLATEACHGDKPFQKHVDLGSWFRGEEYAKDIIQDVQNWVTGWVDWNMALNLQGGPTYIKNFVDSPIIVNSSAGEFYKQPMFYALGHFSKFVQRGSIRLGSSTFCDNVMVVAFQRPDNATAVVILNRANKVVPVTVVDNARGSTKLNLSESSITTMLYW